jgi:hypothetical protein
VWSYTGQNPDVGPGFRMRKEWGSGEAACGEAGTGSGEVSDLDEVYFSENDDEGFGGVEAPPLPV